MKQAAQAKREVRRLLESPDFVSALAEAGPVLEGLPPKALARALLAALCAAQEERRHRAAALLGQAVAGLAGRDLEKGRDILRRLFWSLNEESGSMGWGAPEALAEIMAVHEGLAREFACLLVSLATPGLNPLDNQALLGSVVWGLGRLAQAQPVVMACLELGPALLPWLEAHDPRLRGLAAWAAGQAGLSAARPALAALARDPATLAVFSQGRLREATVGRLAQASLDSLPASA